MNEFLRWEAHEYEEKERTPDWFIAVGIIGGALAIGAFFYGNILFGIFVILAVGTMFLFAKKKPRTIEFILHDRGIHAGSTHYPYENLRSFVIQERTDRPAYRIVFESDKILMPHIVIPLPEDIDPDELRELLLEFLEEGEHRHSLSEQIMERLGF